MLEHWDQRQSLTLASKAGMSNSNPCAGRTIIYKDIKNFQRAIVSFILLIFTVQKPFYSKICVKISQVKLFWG